MAVHKIDVVYPAPVPVGHRVRITWYEIETRGFFGGKESKAHEPWIIDLDTGVEYLSDRLVGRSGAKFPDQPVDVADDAKTSATAVRTLEGRVTRCRVVSVRSFSEFDVQTHLLVEDAP